MAREKNILIVDDDIELGNLLAKAVSDMSQSYMVRVARDVDEAMVQVRKAQTNRNAFDLVITDIKMSGLSGLELLEAMNAIAPATKTIAMTAYNSSDIAERARELNVEAYLTKPFIISEFRQIVRDTLNAQSAPPESEPQVKDSLLTAGQRAAISRALATLRTMTGAAVAFLVHNTGAVIATDPLEPDTSVEELCTALQVAQSTITEQMTKTFDQSCEVRQSYFGTDAYSICTYRLDDAYTAAVAFGPAVKEGQVWYYLRDAADALRSALIGEQVQSRRRRRGTRASVQELLDQFLPEPGQKVEQKASPAKAQEPVPTEATERPTEALEPADLQSLDKIDWDVSPGMDWDSVVEKTDQGFAGLGLEEAREQGLLAADIVPTAEAPAQEAIERPAVDDIDWDVATDLDWDTIVQQTDKGLEGISLEEAQQRGLIDDLDEG